MQALSYFFNAVVQFCTTVNSSCEWPPDGWPDCRYLAEHGVGFQSDASVTFLKCVLLVKGWFRYCGSSTMVVTISHESPLLSIVRLAYSVTTAFPL